MIIAKSEDNSDDNDVVSGIDSDGDGNNHDFFMLALILPTPDPETHG